MSKTCICICKKPAHLKCSRCRCVSYCSSECQKSDWKAHKPCCVDIALEIVNHVRRKILDDIEVIDPWDEKKDGAAWLENEIGMATDYFLSKLKPSTVYPDWGKCNSVEEVTKELRELSSSDLKFIRHFIIDLGGTEESEFFELREKSVDEIREWFNNH